MFSLVKYVDIFCKVLIYVVWRLQLRIKLGGLYTSIFSGANVMHIYASVFLFQPVDGPSSGSLQAPRHAVNSQKGPLHIYIYIYIYIYIRHRAIGASGVTARSCITYFSVELF